MKYIDADKLKAEIERRRLQNRYIDTEGYENELLEIIDSLQKEQPKAALNIDTIRDWSMRFAPDIREEIESTAYHFFILGLQQQLIELF